MAYSSDSEGSSSATGYSTWSSYYARRTGGDGPGTHDAVSNLAESAVNDPNLGGELLFSVSERSVLLVPGDEGKVHLIHQAFYDSANGKFIGIGGLGILSPFIEIDADMVSGNMSVPRSRTRGAGLARIRVPSYGDFLALEPGEFLSAQGTTSSETMSSYVKRTPNYFIAHLDTLEFFHQNGREALAEDVIESIVVGKDELQDESSDDVEAKFGKLLRFLWLVGKGVHDQHEL